jgi:hypothetical protein
MKILKEKDKTFWLVFGALITVPLSSCLKIGPDVWYSQVIWLLGVLCVGIALELWKFNKYLSIFNIVLIYSTLVTANQGLRSIFYLFITSIAFLASYKISLFNKKQREYLIYAILAVFCLQALWVILQKFNLDPIFSYIDNPALDNTVGFSGSRNQIGLFFAITSPLVIALAPILLPFTIIGLWFSATTSAFVAFIVAGFVYTSFYLKHLRIGFVLMTILATIIFFLKYENFSIESYKERFGLIKHSVNEIMTGKALMKQDMTELDGKKITKFTEITTNFMQGYGLGNFIRVSPYTQWKFMDIYKEGGNPQHRYEHMHNDYFEIFYETGLAGFVSMLFLLWNFFLEFIKSNKTKLMIISFCCILAQMVSALGIYTVYTAVSGVLFIVLYGIFKGEERDLLCH